MTINANSCFYSLRDGDDGRWSSFPLRVGNPEQSVRVLISTADYNTKVINPGGCLPDSPVIPPASTCPQSRGELFDASLSSTWSSFGNYSLGLETNLGYDGPASYGLDTVAMGVSNDTGGPSLPRQVVASLVTNLFYTGLFGLGNQPTNFTASLDSNNLTDTVPYPSFLTTLKNQSLIPSRSWAYTAGAVYSEYPFMNLARNTCHFVLLSKRELPLGANHIWRHKQIPHLLKKTSEKQSPSNRNSRNFALILTFYRVERRRLRKLDIWRL